MKRNFIIATIIWFVFINISPQGLAISRESTFGKILGGAEPYNSSQNLTSDAPSLLSSIHTGNLVMTPDAGASIGQIDYASKSMKEFKFPTWDPYMQSGRPMYPADGYNTGIFDPFQIAISFLPIDVVQKIAITSATWTFLLILFSVLSIGFFTKNLWAQIIGVSIILASKPFHYVPNHLLNLGAYVSGAIAFFLVLSLLKRASFRRTLATSLFLGLALLNFAGLGLGISMLVLLSGFFALIIQSGLTSQRVLIYVLHCALSLSIALPHILKIREQQILSTNSQLPYYLGGSVSKRIENLLAQFPISNALVFLSFGTILLFVFRCLPWRNLKFSDYFQKEKNAVLYFTLICVSVSLLGQFGLFEAVGYFIGFNVQSNNIYPMPLTMSLVFIIVTAIDLINNDLKFSRPHPILARASFSTLIMALIFSPFNSILKPQIGVIALLVLAFVLSNHHGIQRFSSANNFLIYFLAFIVFTIPIAHQFYGVIFSVQNQNNILRDKICSKISCTESFRFVALHANDSSGVPGLTSENANAFLYYPTTSSLYRFFEASGGLSLNGIDYADFIASLNTNLYPDDAQHPGSRSFLLGVQRKIFRGEVLDYKTAVEVQNRRNNYLITNASSPLLRYLSVQYIFTKNQLPESKFYELIHTFSDLPNLGRDMSLQIRSPRIFVYEVRRSIPRISFPERVIIRVRDNAKILKYLGDSYDSNLLVLDGKKSQEKSYVVESSGTVTGQSVDVNTIKFTTNQISSQYILINENYHRGWSAKINGVDVQLSRANSVFMSLMLPAGENKVVLKFKLYSSKERFLFMLLPILLFSILFLITRKRKRQY